MKLNKGIIYLPTSRNENKVKYLCICAHQDDAEIMAIDGILKGFYSKTHSFALVVTTDGAGSSRNGKYLNYSDEEMKKVRIEEQKQASIIGRYHSLYLLNYSSSETKSNNEEIENEYIKIIKELKPEVIYTHSLLDKHMTHVSVGKHVINALRKMDIDERPKVLYGCEVWRSLDWVEDDKKIAFDVSRNIKLQKKLLDVFDSQVKGGKSYSEATIGRRKQNATYYKSHMVDKAKLISFAIDMSELINNPEISLRDYCLSFVNDLENDIKDKFD